MATRTTKKVSKKPVRTSSLSRFNPIRALMFVMAFAIIGSWYLISTKANTGYGVRFVFVCAADACSGSEAELRGYAGEIEGWYQREVGRTFQNMGTTSYHSPNPRSYFGAGSNNTDETHNRLYSELQGRGLIQSNVKTVVLLGFRSMNNCGVGGFNGELAIADPFKGCSNIKSAVLAHELGHNLGFNGTIDPWHTNDGTLMHAPLACNGKALGNCSLRADHKNHAYNSPWLRPAPPAPTTTVQGIKVAGTAADPALHQVQVVYQDNVGGTGRGNVGAVQGSGTQDYYFRGIPQGWHRFNLVNIPAGWEAVGYTLCYGRTDCHGNTPTTFLNHNGQPSVVINSGGQTLADLWFHFRRTATTPPPQADDTALTVNVSGYGGAVTMTATTSRDGARHTVGRCTELGGGYQFSVTKSRNCTGGRIGPIAIQAPALSGYTFGGWSGYCNGGISGSTCYINQYDSGSQAVTAKYTASGGGTTTPPPTPPPSNVTYTVPVMVRTQMASKRCWDVPQQRFNAGQTIQLWDCNNTIAQRWVGGSDGTLRTPNSSGLCLDVPQQNFNNDVRVQLWTCNGTIAQKWTAHSDGSVRPTARSNMCLDVAPNGGGISGYPLILYVCHGGTNQKWFVTQ